jgi:hypothetical protein
MTAPILTGKDAFHRVPYFLLNQFRDAVERVPTRKL